MKAGAWLRLHVRSSLQGGGSESDNALRAINPGGTSFQLFHTLA